MEDQAFGTYHKQILFLVMESDLWPVGPGDDNILAVLTINRWQTDPWGLSFIGQDSSSTGQQALCY